jgi:hypothetical protein
MAEASAAAGAAVFAAGRARGRAGSDDGILLRCNRDAMICKGNDSISGVLFRHHTGSANTV